MAELLAMSGNRESPNDASTSKQSLVVDRTEERIKEPHDPGRAKKIARPVYHLLKDSQIKRLLQDLDLSTKGTRQVGEIDIIK